MESTTVSRDVQAYQIQSHIHDIGIYLICKCWIYRRLFRNIDKQWITYGSQKIQHGPICLIIHCSSCLKCVGSWILKTPKLIFSRTKWLQIKQIYVQSIEPIPSSGIYCCFHLDPDSLHTNTSRPPHCDRLVVLRLILPPRWAGFIPPPGPRAAQNCIIRLIIHS